MRSENEALDTPTNRKREEVAAALGGGGEQGSHDALIARGGAYAALFEMQAGRYR